MKPASSTADTVTLRCGYIVVDSATVAFQNSARFEQCIIQQMCPIMILLIFLIKKKDYNLIYYVLNFFLIIFPFQRGTQTRKVSFKIFSLSIIIYTVKNSTIQPRTVLS